MEIVRAPTTCTLATEMFGKELHDCTPAEREELKKQVDNWWMDRLEKSGKEGVGVVFHDQGGRSNPRFCRLIKASSLFFFFRQYHHTMVDTQPDAVGYRSSIYHRCYPCWDKPVEGMKVFRCRRGGPAYYTLYDENKEEIDVWYD